MTWDDQGKRMCIGWPTVAVGSDDDWALDVVSTLLTGGRMSRLHRRLVIDDEIATSVSTQSDTRVDSGIFWLFAECAQSADPARLEAIVDEELALMANEPVGADELARVRSMLAASEAYEEETASDLAEQLGEFATDSDWRLAVTERRVIGWCMPKASAKTVAKSTAKSTAKPRRTKARKGAAR
jgi:predicted Zn-dependent peptidase